MSGRNATRTGWIGGRVLFPRKACNTQAGIGGLRQPLHACAADATAAIAAGDLPPVPETPTYDCQVSLPDAHHVLRLPLRENAGADQRLEAPSKRGDGWQTSLILLRISATLNQRVEGSSPSTPTNINSDLTFNPSRCDCRHAHVMRTVYSTRLAFNARSIVACTSACVASRSPCFCHFSLQRLLRHSLGA